MYFEDLTCVPIDLEALDITLLDGKDKERLNEYHRQVYERLSPFLSPEEGMWLKHITREI